MNARHVRSDDRVMIVRRCDESDLPDVFALYRRIMRFPPADSVERYWTWKVLGNPCRRGEALPVWVAREDGALIGGLTEIPIRLERGGRQAVTAWAADFMVDPRFRGRGLGKALFDHYRRHNDVAMAMGPAPDAPTMRIAQSLGFVASPPLRFLFKLLTLRPLTSRLPLGSLVGPALARASRRPLRRLGRLRPSATPWVRIEEISSFGPAFDILWTAVARETTVAVHRDQASMNWRYRDNPFQRYRMLGAWSGDVLAGCVVFKVVHHDAFTYATIAEIVVPAAAVDVLEALLARVLEELQRDGVDIVKTLASAPHLVTLLRRAGFHALGRECAFVIAVAPALQPEFGAHLDPHTWHLTKGDADLDMVPDFMTYLPS